MEGFGISATPQIGHGTTLNGASADRNNPMLNIGLRPTPSTVTSGVNPNAVLGLDYAFLQVRDMVKLFMQPHPTEPTKLSLAQCARRRNWINSETQELMDSHTLEDQADAFLDVLVFAIGGLVEMGIMPQPLLDIVNAANMAKAVRNEDGTLTVVKDEEGKVQKPAGWKENFEPQPRIAAEIARQKASGLLSQIGA